MGRHLSGDITVGVYQLSDDGESRVKWLVWDIDGSDNREGSQRHTLALASRLRELGIPFLPSDSGSKGFHLTAFFSEPVAAAKAQALGQFVESVARPPDGVTVEVFPKQSSLARASSYGNLVKPIFALHRKTLKRSQIIDGRFEPVDDQWARLASVVRITPGQLDELLDEHRLDADSSPVASVGSDLGLEGVGNLTPPCMANMMREGLADGNRDIGTFRLACYLRDRGLPVRMTQAAVDDWNLQHNHPPLDDVTIQTKVESAFVTAYSPFPCEEQVLDGYCQSNCRFWASKVKKRWTRYGHDPATAAGQISRI